MPEAERGHQGQCARGLPVVVVVVVAGSARSVEGCLPRPAGGSMAVGVVRGGSRGQSRPAGGSVAVGVAAAVLREVACLGGSSRICPKLSVAIRDSTHGGCR